MPLILEKGNPILRLQAEPVDASEFGTPELKQLVQDMFNIMEEQGAVGVAAPQIGISKQVIVFGTAYSRRPNLEVNIPNAALINPTLTILSEEQESGYEGCLNSGELRGPVPRATAVEYSGFDVEGNPVTKHATGFEARVVQHEIDHLKGILFFDRITDKAELTTSTELQQRP